MSEHQSVSNSTSAVSSSAGPQEPAQHHLQPGATGRARCRGGSRRRVAVMVLWVTAALVTLVDQVTKAWALNRLGQGEHVALLGDLLGLVLVRNPGAAFSLASGYTWILALVAVVVVVAVVRVSRRLLSVRWAVVLGLVLGGAVGNLIDRLVRPPGFLRGHVIDFISYNGRFVGNVADIAIVVAAVGIMVLSLTQREPEGAHDTTSDTSDAGDAEDGEVPGGGEDPGGAEDPEERGSARRPADLPPGTGQRDGGAQGEVQA